MTMCPPKEGFGPIIISWLGYLLTVLSMIVGDMAISRLVASAAVH